MPSKYEFEIQFHILAQQKTSVKHKLIINDRCFDLIMLFCCFRFDFLFFGNDLTQLFL